MTGFQLALSIDDSGLCDYGQPDVGQARHCDKPATHSACWHLPAGKEYYGETLSGRIACCLFHANYYANAWTPRYPAETGSAWIEILPAAVA